MIFYTVFNTEFTESHRVTQSHQDNEKKISVKLCETLCRSVSSVLKLLPFIFWCPTVSTTSPKPHNVLKIQVIPATNVISVVLLIDSQTVAFESG